MSRSCCINEAKSSAPAPTAEVPPKFYVKEDWLAALSTFLLSGALFLYCMCPTVTLQDSGELVTAAYHFGVPHPSGYPLWTLLAWLWRHLIPIGNPACQICTFSVFCGALAAALVTLLAKRSTLLLLQDIRWRTPLPPMVARVLALCCGISAGLLFACNRSVWYWACAPEMYSFSTLLFVLTFFLFLFWVFRPDRRRWLLLCVLLCGLAFTNDDRASRIIPTMLLLLTLAQGVGRIKSQPDVSWRPHTWMPLLHEFWTLLCVALFIVSTLNFAKAIYHGQFTWEWSIFNASRSAVIAISVGLPLLIVLGWLRSISWRLALQLTAIFSLTLLAFLYLPLAASTNPPMNWGYTATLEGFAHHTSGGSYCRPHLADWFSWANWVTLTRVISQQYSPCLTAIGLVGILGYVFVWRSMARQGRNILLATWLALFTTAINIIFLYTLMVDPTDNDFVFSRFAPLLGVFAVIIAHGCAVILAWVWTHTRLLRRTWLVTGSAALLLAPLAPLQRNWDSCNQRKHDFGYEFGFRMFNPGGCYPPMERDAVLFAGTDAGRFTSTYLIFCESQARLENRYVSPRLDAQLCRNFDRRDVFIITQNALADGTYMEQIRDHYGVNRPRPDKPTTLEKFLPWQRAVMRYAWHLLGRDAMYPEKPIALPNPRETNDAFRRYVEDVQAGRIQPGNGMHFENGCVGVEGVQGVMAINGILAKWIFDQNKGKHTFYYVESYAIPWMYPFLQPAGTIMKLAQVPLPTPQQNPTLWADIQQRDFAYWTQLLRELDQRPEFQRDHDARQAFSKLRCASAGLYDFHQLYPAAEAAYRQAIATCLDSREASLRMAICLASQNKLSAAVNTIRALQLRDAHDTQVREVLEQFETLLRNQAEATATRYPAGAVPSNTAPGGLVTPWSSAQKK